MLVEREFGVKQHEHGCNQEGLLREKRKLGTSIANRTAFNALQDDPVIPLNSGPFIVKLFEARMMMLQNLVSELRT